ncbi:MAG TPA: tRNA (pseudouridine(54)-N(1))-methyltransferase TrmY [Nanoarchaeota archaeon]|nr:tRNA (pseudouridine(54)-N(1))-methyltransferase TrmY [Nanoarchaeota archaeon]
MRTFILFSRATTDANFDIDNLYETGRLDLVARCCLNVLWISEHIRDNTQFIVSLNGGPKPPVAIRFDGSKLGDIFPSEKGIAFVIKKALKAVRDESWISCHQGVSVSRKSFQELIKEASNIYVLDSKGENISKLNIKDGTFVLGDQVGINAKELAFALRKGKKLSLGPKNYLASFAVAVVNWVLDQK